MPEVCCVTLTGLREPNLAAIFGLGIRSVVRFAAGPPARRFQANHGEAIG